MSVTSHTQTFNARHISPKVLFHDGWFCLLIELLGSLLVGRHDFPEEFSVIALILGKECFPSFNELVYLGRGMFLSSTIFEERHLIVIQFISYLLPEVTIKKISGFRLVLNSFLQSLGICAQKVD